MGERNKIMQVIDLWFECKDANCMLIPLKTKKEKRKYWREGKSINNSARRRRFMRAVEGYRLYRNDGNLVLFVCKYGEIIILNLKAEKFSQLPNFYDNPIKDVETCNVCLKRIANEGRLFV